MTAWWHRLPEWRRDGLFGVAVAVLGLAALIWSRPQFVGWSNGATVAVAGGVAVASGVAIGLRRVHTDAAFVLALLVVVVAATTWYPVGTEMLAVAACGYCAVAYRSRFAPSGALALMLAAWALNAVILAALGRTSASDNLATAVSAVVLSCLVVGLGMSVRTHRLLAEDLAERNREIECLRQAETESAVAAERSRIARELHDLVAHHISAMVITARAGTRAQLTPEAEAPLRTIAACGAEALDAMRGMVAVLRSGKGDTGLQPQPGIGELPELLEGFARVGLDVTCRSDVTKSDLSAALGLTVYRIVQESLTNVLRHAGTRRAWVGLRSRGGWLILTVDDDGSGDVPTAPPPGSSCHGVVGMTERAALTGGRLRLTRSPYGGCRVDVRIPLTRRGSAPLAGTPERLRASDAPYGRAIRWRHVS